MLHCSAPTCSALMQFSTVSGVAVACWIQVQHAGEGRLAIGEALVVDKVEEHLTLSLDFNLCILRSPPVSNKLSLRRLVSGTGPRKFRPQSSAVPWHSCSTVASLALRATWRQPSDRSVAAANILRGRSA